MKLITRKKEINSGCEADRTSDFIFLFCLISFNLTLKVVLRQFIKVAQIQEILKVVFTRVFSR